LSGFGRVVEKLAGRRGLPTCSGKPDKKLEQSVTSSVMTSRRRLLCASVLGRSTAVALAAFATCPHHASAQSVQTRPADKQTAAAKKQKPAKQRADGPESIEVHAGIETSNGVRNITAGGGLMPVQTAPQAISGVNRDFIAKQAATSSPLALIQNLPGVNYAGADAFGQSDQSTIYIRGLDQTQFGYTYEGIPIADPTAYAPFSSEAADAENISRIDVAQGHADITTPVYNAVGGEIKQYTMDPALKAGGRFAFSEGSRKLNRDFIRLDTGEILNTGIRGFVSYSYQYNNLWTGPGINRRSHVDSKWIKEWGDGNRISFIASWTMSHYNFLDTTTYNRYINKLKDGSSGANYDQDFNESWATADSGWWNLNFGDRNSIILGLPMKFTLRHDLHLSIAPYYVNIHGWSDYGVQEGALSYFGTRPSGIPASYAQPTQLSVDDFNQHTVGVNNVLSWDTSSHNRIDAGYWYSYYDQLETSPFVALNADGSYSNAHGNYPIRTASGDILNNYHVHLISQLNSLFISDTYKMLNDRLTFSAGLKYVMTNYASTNAIPGDSYKYGRSDAQPIPQVSLSYNLTPHDQIFIDGATGFREPSGILVYGAAWSISNGALSQNHSTNLKPEYSISEEIGYRHYGLFNLSLALFNYNFVNRQLSTLEIIDGRQTSVSINAGGQTSRGVQAEIGLRPWHHFSPYMSFQYLHATIDNNLSRGTEYLATAGKTSVASPHFSGSIGLSFDDGRFFGNVEVQGVSSQYSTFINDEMIPGYFTSNMTVGYRLPNVAILKRPQIQLNFNNVTDVKYLSGVAGVSLNAKDTKGIFGTVVSGNEPTYNVGGGFAMMGTISAGF